MAQTSGPWTPADPEAPQAPGEVLTQDVWELMLAELVDGIIGTPGSASYAATPTGTRGVSHATGTALARAHWHKSTSAEILTSAANNGTLARVDRSTLRVNRSAKSVTLNLIEGTVGAGAPALLDTDTITDRPLWQWTVTPGATSISDLVDQRQWLGTTLQPCTSTNRPVPPRKGKMAVEVDTGNVIRYDGTAWVIVLGDTGWLTIPLPNGPDAAAWSVADAFQYRLLNGVVYLKFSIVRWPDNSLKLSDANGSTPYRLPVGFRPVSDTPPALGFGNHSRSNVQLFIYPNGDVRVYPLDTDLAASRRIYAWASFPLG